MAMSFFLFVCLFIFHLSNLKCIHEKKKKKKKKREKRARYRILSFLYHLKITKNGGKCSKRKCIRII